MRPVLEANRKRYENGMKPKRSKTEANEKQNRSKAEANKDKDKYKDKDESVHESEDKDLLTTHDMDGIEFWDEVLSEDATADQWGGIV